MTTATGTGLLVVVALIGAAFARRSHRRWQRRMAVLRRLASLRLEAQTSEHLPWDRRKDWI